MNKMNVAGKCVLALFCVSGCATRTQSGAAIGAASGAAIGAGVGSVVNSSVGAGALIGAGMGAVSGAIIGNQMDEQEDRRKQELKDRQTADAALPQDRYIANREITKQNIIEWSRGGVPKQVIIDRIERSGTKFSLTAADENKLRENAVSEEVMLAMRETSRR